LYSSNHAGLIQYWKSFPDLESWSLKSKEHKSWWKEIESSNKWNNLNIYHEVFIIPKEKIETIYNLSVDKKDKKSELPGLAGFLKHNTDPQMRARRRFLESPR